MNRLLSKRCLIGIVIVAVLLLPGLAIVKPVNACPPGAKATWTFALFMNGDNDLAFCWPEWSLPWLKAVPASAKVNIVALVSLEDSSRTLVEKISGSSVKVLKTYEKMDMGISSTLSWWINESTALYPSTYYALTIWDHGYGWNYVSYDELFNHTLDMPQLQKAIADSGKRIDVLGFDACNMGNIEVVYQMAKTNLVSYMVGSEESVPYDGFPYDKMLTKLVRHPAMQPKDFSMAMVDGWGEYYSTQSGPDYVELNLAAYDVAQMKNTVGIFETWTSDMLAKLPVYRSLYKHALRASYSAYDTTYFVDMYDLDAHLLAARGLRDRGLRTATQNVESSITQYVLNVWNSDDISMCKGITIYWGVGDEWEHCGPGWPSGGNYMETAFSIDTGWGDFLIAYNTR